MPCRTINVYLFPLSAFDFQSLEYQQKTPVVFGAAAEFRVVIFLICDRLATPEESLRLPVWVYHRVSSAGFIPANLKHLADSTGAVVPFRSLDFTLKLADVRVSATAGGQ